MIDDHRIRQEIKSMTAPEQMKLVELYLTDYIGAGNLKKLGAEARKRGVSKGMMLYALIHSGGYRLGKKDFRSGSSTRTTYDKNIGSKLDQFKPSTSLRAVDVVNF